MDFGTKLLEYNKAVLEMNFGNKTAVAAEMQQAWNKLKLTEKERILARLPQLNEVIIVDIEQPPVTGISLL